MVSGTRGPATVDGGLGNDRIVAKVQLDLPFDRISPIADRLTVMGGSGVDLLNVVSGVTFEDANPLYDDIGALTATIITGLEMPVGIVYQELEELVIDLGSGRDDFTILGTHAGTAVLNTDALPDTAHTEDPSGTVYLGTDQVNIGAISGTTTVNAGDDSDTVYVGSLAPVIGGKLNDIAAGLIINGQGGATDKDTLYIDDSGDANANVGTLTNTTIGGLGLSASGSTYGTFELLNIKLGSGGDTLTVQSTHGAETIVESGDGIDQLNVQTIAGITTVDAYAANDFKFVALDLAAQKVLIGHVSPRSGWVGDASVSRPLVSGTDYSVKLVMKGTSVSATLNGALALSHAFNSPTVDGMLGTLGRGGTTSFDSFRMLTNDAAIAEETVRPTVAATGVLSLASALDTNRDGVVSPLDALLVINQFNESSLSGRLQQGTYVGSPLDLNGDGTVSPLDALLVTNELNANASAGARQAEAVTNNALPAGAKQGMSNELLAAIAGDIQSSQQSSRKKRDNVAEQKAGSEQQLDRIFEEWM